MPCYHKNSCIGLMFILAITLAIEGCAFGARNTTLQYPPQSEDGAISTAQALALPASHKVEISLAPFVDQRAEINIIGTVRNAWGMRTADVIAANNVSDWILDAMRTDLEIAGYTVTEVSEDSQTTLTGDITNVFCDMYLSYEGNVSLYVKLSRNGEEVISKSYIGSGSAGVAFAGTAESFGQSLSLALSDALKQLITDLNKELAFN